MTTMANNQTYGDTIPTIVYTEYYVRLMSSINLAAFVNPNFLLYNGIIPDSWRHQPPAIMTQNTADIEYDNGVAVRGNNDEVGFALVAEVAPLSDVELCIEVARRFLDEIPGVEYESIMTDVQGYAMLPDGCPGIMNIGSEFNGVLPVISHEAVYTAPGRETRFHVQEDARANPDLIDCLELRARTTHFIPPAHRNPARSSLIKETLGNWSDALNGFNELATNFINLHILEGGTR